MATIKYVGRSHRRVIKVADFEKAGVANPVEIDTTPGVEVKVTDEVKVYLLASEAAEWEEVADSATEEPAVEEEPAAQKDIFAELALPVDAPDIDRPTKTSKR